MTITGYPIIFGERSVDLGGFIEIIRPSAVDRTLRTRADVVALVGHDANKPIGRTSARTLLLEKDQRGLRVDVTADPHISYVNDLERIIRRGDAVGGSFAFAVEADGDIWSLSNGIPLREVVDMSIREVSVGVTWPAYPGTRLQLSERQQARSDWSARKRFNERYTEMRLRLAR